MMLKALNNAVSTRSTTMGLTHTEVKGLMVRDSYRVGPKKYLNRIESNPSAKMSHEVFEHEPLKDKSLDQVVETVVLWS